MLEHTPAELIAGMRAMGISYRVISQALRVSTTIVQLWAAGKPVDAGRAGLVRGLAAVLEGATPDDLPDVLSAWIRDLPRVEPVGMGVSLGLDATIGTAEE